MCFLPSPVPQRTMPAEAPSVPAAFRVVAAQAESVYQALGFTCRFQRMLQPQILAGRLQYQERHLG